MSKTNSAMNERIQNLAVKAIDEMNENAKRDLNELITLIIPKLRFFIWGFMSTEEDTDDVLYNALEKICCNIDTYNPNFKFTTWTFNIAKNEALTWLNKSPKNQMQLEDCFNFVANTLIDDSDDVLEKEVLREDVLSDVYEEIQKVSIENGNLMLLEMDINHRKGKDIAEMYGICENTVKTRIRAGRKLVRARVLEKHPELNQEKLKFSI